MRSAQEGGTMKICPLVTQASILDDSELLVREIDDVEPAARNEKKTPAADDNDLFLNPQRARQDDAPLLDEIAPVVPVRFLAKSFRGQVECLGELCRFHDDSISACRFERLFTGASAEPAGDGGALAHSIAELEKSLQSRQENSGEVLERLRELESKNETRIAGLTGELERKIGEIAEALRSSGDENRKVLDALTLTLEARADELERKIESGDERLSGFAEDVSGWKESLSKNLERIESGFGEHRKLAEEISGSNSGLMALVENQKKNIAEEEKRRQTAEARHLNNGGVMAYHNGQYEKAVDLFIKAIETDPAMTEAHNNLGLTYTEMNDDTKATEAFKKAISLSPELAAAYNNLGYVFYRLGSFEEAIEMYNEAIGRSANNSSAYTNLGNAYYKLDRVEEAITAWKRALEIDPANEKARRNLKRFHAEVK